MPKPSEPRSWGVWVYIVGDHEGLSADEATEINTVATEEALKLVRAARGLDDIYLSVHVDLTNEKGSSIYRVPGVREPERRPEDRTSLENLVAFLRKEKADRPTTHNLVILWGHSGGPMGLFSDPDGGGPGTGQIGFPEFEKLLGGFKNAAQAPIDILLVKSCYVATLEAAYELERIAELVICSQARVPLRTWTIWEDVLEQLGREKSPQAAARDILAAIDRHYRDVAERNLRAEIPFSLLRPAGVLELRERIEMLFDALYTHRDSSAVMRAIDDARPATGGDAALVDVRRLCSNLVNTGDEELKRYAAALDDAISPALIVGNVPKSSDFGGVGVFHFPRDPLLRVDSFANVVTEDSYRKLTFPTATRWIRLAMPNAVLDDPAGSGKAKEAIVVSSAPVGPVGT